VPQLYYINFNFRSFVESLSFIGICHRSLFSRIDLLYPIEPFPVQLSEYYTTKKCSNFLKNIGLHGCSWGDISRYIWLSSDLSTKHAGPTIFVANYHVKMFSIFRDRRFQIRKLFFELVGKLFFAFFRSV